MWSSSVLLAVGTLGAVKLAHANELVEDHAGVVHATAAVDETAGLHASAMMLSKWPQPTTTIQTTTTKTITPKEPSTKPTLTSTIVKTETSARPTVTLPPFEMPPIRFPVFTVPTVVQAPTVAQAPSVTVSTVTVVPSSTLSHSTTHQTVTMDISTSSTTITSDTTFVTSTTVTSNTTFVTPMTVTSHTTLVQDNVVHPTVPSSPTTVKVVPRAPTTTFLASVMVEPSSTSTATVMASPSATLSHITVHGFGPMDSTFSKESTTSQTITSHNPVTLTPIITGAPITVTDHIPIVSVDVTHPINTDGRPVSFTNIPVQSTKTKFSVSTVLTTSHTWLVQPIATKRSTSLLPFDGEPKTVRYGFENRKCHALSIQAGCPPKLPSKKWLWLLVIPIVLSLASIPLFLYVLRSLRRSRASQNDAEKQSVAAVPVQAPAQNGGTGSSSVTGAGGPVPAGTPAGGATQTVTSAPADAGGKVTTVPASTTQHVETVAAPHDGAADAFDNDTLRGRKAARPPLLMRF